VTSNSTDCKTSEVWENVEFCTWAACVTPTARMSRYMSASAELTVSGLKEILVDRTFDASWVIIRVSRTMVNIPAIQIKIVPKGE